MVVEENQIVCQCLNTVAKRFTRKISGKLNTPEFVSKHISDVQHSVQLYVYQAKGTEREPVRIRLSPRDASLVAAMVSLDAPKSFLYSPTKPFAEASTSINLAFSIIPAF